MIGPYRAQSGSIASHLLTFLLLLFVAGVSLFFFVFGHVVPPGHIGVRQIKFGYWQGFSKRGLQPGLHWGVPGGFYSIVYLLPQTMQTLDFHREDPAEGVGLPALEIQTSDRATIDVDITVLSRIYPSSGIDTGPDGEKIQHGGPADLVTKVGAQPADWQNHIRRTAEDRLKRALGTIAAGQFYDTHLREKALEIARKGMQEILLPYGIHIEGLLLRRYSYRDERIDQAIFQKNLQDQEERLALQASGLAKVHADLEQVSAEWDAKIQTSKVDGENTARIARSEGDFVETQKRAQGDLELSKAKAEVDRLRASALSSSSGANFYVARDLAVLLTSIHGGVVSNLDPYDLDGWMKRLGAVNKEGQ